MKKVGCCLQLGVCRLHTKEVWDQRTFGRQLETWMDRHPRGKVIGALSGRGPKVLGSMGRPSAARGDKSMDRDRCGERCCKGGCCNMKGCYGNCCIRKHSGRCGNEVKGATTNP